MVTRSSNRKPHERGSVIAVYQRWHSPLQLAKPASNCDVYLQLQREATNRPSSRGQVVWRSLSRLLTSNPMGTAAPLLKTVPGCTRGIWFVPLLRLQNDVKHKYLSFDPPGKVASRAFGHIFSCFQSLTSGCLEAETIVSARLCETQSKADTARLIVPQPARC